ncbi:MAG TPA: HNH endonuclease signature motif containing protein, partial [Thermomicrobiales bacterium]|nr:HNH endonuclease signature motif containing protein [Thermomicrobiales bacterium]
MPRKSTGKYPHDWGAIATRTKEEAGWACVRCGVPHSGKMDGDGLTVHHIDLNPANCDWWNLVALCQRCHLQIQHKVILERPWVMEDHSDWFKPYVAGWYAKRYLGQSLSREETVARLDELLQLERQAVLL